MFFANGFVYGGEPQEPLKIQYVRSLPNRMMVLKFNNGETRLFDATVLAGEVFDPLKADTVFFAPKLDHGIVTWMDGELDCAPEYMYEHSYEYLDDCSNIPA